jgi:hypothetical protein
MEKTTMKTVLESVKAWVLKFVLAIFAVLSAIMTFLFLRQKQKTEKLEAENITQEIEIEKANVIRETTSQSLSDLINVHNSELRGDNPKRDE